MLRTEYSEYAQLTGTKKDFNAMKDVKKIERISLHRDCHCLHTSGIKCKFIYNKWAVEFTNWQRP